MNSHQITNNEEDNSRGKINCHIKTIPPGGGGINTKIIDLTIYYLLSINLVKLSSDERIVLNILKIALHARWY